MPMQLVGFDTETYLITQYDVAPKPVVCSWYDGQNKWLTYPTDEDTAHLFMRDDIILVGQNIAYDLVLMMRWVPWLIPYIVKMLDEGRVRDTQLRQQLWHLENKGERGYPSRISLADLELLLLNRDRSAQKKGPDIWRLKYGTLDGLPFSQWPVAAIEYALDDAVGTFDVFIAQEGHVYTFPTEDLQVRAAVVLQMISVWGFKTNPEANAKHREEVEARMVPLKAELDAFHVDIDGVPCGLVGKGSERVLHDTVCQGWHLLHKQQLEELGKEYQVGFDWPQIDAEVSSNRDLRMILEQAAKGGHVPPFCWNSFEWNPQQFLKKAAERLTKVPRGKKGPSCGEDVIEPIVHLVPILTTRAKYKHEEKMLGTFVDPYTDRDTIHSRFSPLVTTGRTGSSGPNTQNIPHLFRTQLHARPGYRLGTVDQSTLEMVTLAATILFRYGKSNMADVINAGRDLHCHSATMILGRPYEEYIVGQDENGRDKARKDQPYKDERQGMKALNFGAPGGLGALAFQAYAATTYGVHWSLNEAKQNLRKWKDAWPEISTYLTHIGQECDGNDGRRTVAVNNSGRRKAESTYTQAANYPFQSLAADGMKDSMWELTKYQLLGWFWTEAPPEYHQRAPTNYGIEYRDNPMRLSHIVNFVHDEVVQEHPDHLAEEAFALQKEVMVDVMAKWTPGVQPAVEGSLDVEWEH